jgi:Leucine-rich repeat (LRR) protein
MKRKLIFILCLIIHGICQAQTTAIPDANFEQFLVTFGYDTNGLNGNILNSDAEAITTLPLQNQNVSDLTGIEAFTNLTYLACQGNNLTSLDVSNNAALTSLRCQGNNLTSLNISGLTVLQTFYCSANDLTTLDLTTNTSLTYLNCAGNNLTSLNTSSASALEQLYCNANNLTSLNTSSNISLSVLHCFQNNLATLDVTNNLELESLYCGQNFLTDLDISNNPQISTLFCNNNNISDLNLTNLELLTILGCNNNTLTSLDVRNNNNTNFTIFNASNNPTLSCISVDDVSYSQANWTDIDPQTIFNTNCSQTTYVPDDNFEQALIDLGYDSGALDNYVSTLAISAVTDLPISNENISDLTGIEDFISLETLDVSNNTISHINITANATLVSLNIANNNLTFLDVSPNLVLNSLNCANNNLSILNVANGNNTNFVAFDATGNSNLECIEVDDATYAAANWTNIDTQSSFSEDCAYTVTYIPDPNFEQALIDLNIDTGVLDTFVETAFITNVTSLDVEGKNISDLTGIEAFTNLLVLDCKVNNLSFLDLSTNINLLALDCAANNIALLNITNNFNLLELDCAGNNLNSLDVFSNPDLTELNCAGNTIESLNLTNNINLSVLGCAGNQLTNLDVTNNINLISINCFNNQLTTLDVTNNEALESLFCFNNQLTNLNIGLNSLLTSLNCSTNQLTTLNVLSLSILNTLQCGDNLLTSLNVSNNSNLVQLSCYANQLTSLDVSNNNALEIFYCDLNQITELDLTSNTALNTLGCWNNQLSVLNIKNGNNTSILEFGAFNNPLLECIDVDDADYSTTNWTNIDAQTSFSTNCSGNSIVISPKIVLQGAALNANTGEETLMRDDLRVANYISTNSPYADNLSCNAAVFNTAGPDAIIDWVWVELRDATTNTDITTSRSALLQRDGDVVDINGVSSLDLFVDSGDYYVVINHRNHLGVMSNNTFSLSETPTVVDFSNNAFATFGSNAQVQLASGVMALWSGDVNSDGLIRSSGSNNDVNAIKDFILADPLNVLNFITFSSTGYLLGDLNMDGVMRFSGAPNDSNTVKDNVLAHPGNVLGFPTYTITEQVPNN